MTLSLDQVWRRFGSVEVLRGLTLAVAPGDYVCLLGASGCGKTTLLRLAAGLDRPDGGRVLLDGRDIAGIPPEARSIAMVFQQAALWPNRTVAENVGYGLELRGVGGVVRNRRVSEVLEQVRMAHLLHRFPGELSGGERQRVALARALAIRPSVLLLDEPLSHLDGALRRDLRAELRRVHAENGLTVLHVTHDPQEALALGDRVGVVCGGVVARIAAPRTLYRCPGSRGVAEAFGEIQWIEGVASSDRSRGVEVTTNLGRFQLDDGVAPGEAREGWLGFRAGAVRPGIAPRNSFSAVVRDVTFLGSDEEWTLDADGGVRLRVRIADTGPGPKPAGVMPFTAMASGLVWVPRG